MTEAFDYEDMHHLVDRLSPSQVHRLRRLVAQDEELGQVAEVFSSRAVEEREVPDGLMSLIGAVDGPEDLAERHDDYIRQRMQERFGDQT